MKTAHLAALAGTLMFSMGTDVLAGDRRCAAGVYCADEMVCVRTVSYPQPTSMHPDYYNSVVSVKTLKSTRRDGSLVDALQISDDPVGPKTPSVKAAWSMASFNSGNYGAPMRVKGNQVILPWGPTSNFSQGVRFTIVASRLQNGHRLDVLRGQEHVKGDLVGSYSSTYVCEAKVVTQLSRIDDFTSRAR